MSCRCAGRCYRHKESKLVARKWRPVKTPDLTCFHISPRPKHLPSPPLFPLLNDYSVYQGWDKHCTSELPGMKWSCRKKKNPKNNLATYNSFAKCCMNHLHLNTIKCKWFCDLVTLLCVNSCLGLIFQRERFLRFR